MEPVDAVVREAVLHSFATFSPASGDGSTEDPPAVSDPAALPSARAAFADALAAALRAGHEAGLGASEMAAAASAGCTLEASLFLA